jgi:hypothetical protein
MKSILVDFDTEPGRYFEDIHPIGVLLERGSVPGFDTMYLPSVTDDADSGHDNYVRTMEQVAEFRQAWDKGEETPGMTTVEKLFMYLATGGYLGLRLRTIGKVEDGVTLEEAFDLYVVQEKPLAAMRDEEFPVDV